MGNGKQNDSQYEEDREDGFPASFPMQCNMIFTVYY